MARRLASKHLQTVSRSDLTVGLKVDEWCSTSGYTTFENFAYWVTPVQEVQSGILDGVEELKASREQLAVLRQCWSVAIAEVVHRSKSDNKRTHDEAPEDQLPAADQKEVEITSSDFYNWSVSPNLRSSDGILARFRREATKWALAMCEVHRLRTMVHAATSTQNKPARFGELEVSWVGQHDAPHVPNANRLRVVHHKLRVLTNTWAMAGCF